MQLCCVLFSQLIENGVNKGKGLWIEEYCSAPVFFITWRACDKDSPRPEYTEDYKALAKESNKTLFFLALEMPMVYCPCCGVKLSDHYSANWRDLVTLTSANSIHEGIE